MINAINSSGDDTSITITIDATDNIGIYYYYFQLDNEEEIRSEEASYTFEGLEKDSVHTITVRVEDAAGNVASDSKEVTVGLRAGDVILAASKPQGQTTDWTNNGQGTTYYYTGDIPSEELNNWVQFAGFWWRIIRINGDGSIRMIYQGTSANTTGTGTQIGTNAFNSSHNNNMYVGFKYTSNQVHGTGTNSTILNTLNNWYLSNFADDAEYAEYAEYIDGNAGFCGDRTPSTSSSSSNGSGGTGKTATYYGAYIRLESNNNPSLQCDSQDVYTTTDSSTGNKSLQYPIGLVTVDEAALTGITRNNANTGSYLYTGQTYWTMSPYTFRSYACVFYVWSDGGLNNAYVTSTYGVRPVINLKSAIAITGSGSKTDPFKVVP